MQSNPVYDLDLWFLRRKAAQFVRRQRQIRENRLRRNLRDERAKARRLKALDDAQWEFWNTFLGRRVERHVETGEFRIIGGQVTVTA